MLLDGPLPPVDPATLEQMREIFVWAVAGLGLSGVALKGVIKALRTWSDANRHDQAEGHHRPRRTGKPNYKK